MYHLRVYLQIKSDIINLLLALYMFWHLVDLIAALKSILKPLNIYCRFDIWYKTKLTILDWVNKIYVQLFLWNARV